MTTICRNTCIFTSAASTKLIDVLVRKIEFTNTRKAKAASGRLSFKQGYNQRCQWYQNLLPDIPKLHAKFHQNWCTSFGEKCVQDSDIL